MRSEPRRELLEQLRSFLPADRPMQLSDARRVYESDPELFYSVAPLELAQEDIAIRALQKIVRTLAVMIRDGFTIDSKARTPLALGLEGGALPLDDLDSDRGFLEKLFAGTAQDKSLAGHSVSRACVAFHLDRFPWEDEIRKGRILRIAPEDARDVMAGLVPRHHYYELIDCAREVVRAPTGVWEGIRHENDKTPWGHAYCGKPSRSWNESGAAGTVPDRYVYMVYADPDGYVFDWDWVEADPDDPRLPVRHETRFFKRSEITSDELLVGNLGALSGSFRSAGAYSAKGDCVFFYIDERKSYARRIDEYVTLFFPLDSSSGTASIGFKIKYVGRLLDALRRYKRGDQDKISLTYQPDQPDRHDYVGIDVLFLMRAWLAEGWPKIKSVAEAMQLLKELESLGTREVMVPRELVEQAA